MHTVMLLAGIVILILCGLWTFFVFLAAVDSSETGDLQSFVILPAVMGLFGMIGGAVLVWGSFH